MALFKILRGISSKLINTDGTINSATPWVDGQVYYCTDTHDLYIDHLDDSNTKVRSELNAKNADTATKLKTSRTISLGNGVTSTAKSFNGTTDIAIPVNTIKEAFLSWGGKSISGSHGPIDASMIPTLGANRLAFLPEDSITVEYSRDNGETWTAIDSDRKHRVFGAYGSNFRGFTIGNNNIKGADTSAYQLRITFDSVEATVYTTLNKFAIYVSTSGG